MHWPSSEPALDCPAEAVRWSDAGTMWVANCSAAADGVRPPAGAALTLGMRLNLNEVSAEDLQLVPGIGPTLARAIVAARSGGRFRSWEEVDEVRGVGPAKLEALKRWTELR
jgi:competence protein ComEA